MNRRQLLAGASLVGVSEAHATERRSVTIEIEAPFDVFVISIAHQGPIKKGDVIAKLRSLQIEQLEIEISLHSRHVDILERPLKDGRVDAEIQLAKQKASALESDMKKRDDIVTQFEAQQSGMTQVAFEVEKHQIEATDAKTAYLSAQLAAFENEAKKEDAIAKLALAREKLAEHGEKISKMKEALTIISPVDGSFTPSSGINLSVKRGNQIGSVST